MASKAIDINESTIKNYVESIRPEDLEMRKQVDIGYSYKNNVFILFQIRPEWDNPEKKQHLEFAKIRYFKSKQTWSLYWMRASGKWQLYEPLLESTHLDIIIKTIKANTHGCFFG